MRVGCPIRISTDQSLLAAPHGFSQRATSFIASWCQGIHRMPLSRSIPKPPPYKNGSPALTMHRNHRKPAADVRRRAAGGNALRRPMPGVRRPNTTRRPLHSKPLTQHSYPTPLNPDGTARGTTLWLTPTIPSGQTITHRYHRTHATYPLSQEPARCPARPGAHQNQIYNTKER